MFATITGARSGRILTTFCSHPYLFVRWFAIALEAIEFHIVLLKNAKMGVTITERVNITKYVLLIYIT